MLQLRDVPARHMLDSSGQETRNQLMAKKTAKKKPAPKTAKPAASKSAASVKKAAAKKPAKSAAPKKVAKKKPATKAAAKKTSTPAATTKKPVKKPATKTVKKSRPKTKPAAAAQPALDAQPAASLDSYIATLNDWRKECVATLRKMIQKAAPGAAEKVDGEQPVYEHHGPLAWIKAHAGHVNLGFWRGKELPDPRKLLEGAGDAMRQIKLSSLKDLGKKELQELINLAAKLNEARADRAVASASAKADGTKTKTK